MQELKGSKEDLKKITHKRKKRAIRRSNARLYPMYKMFSWDLLCFYSIQFLFYTTTKGLDASQVLITNAAYLISKIVSQIPSVTIVDLCGYKKSLIIGNSIIFLAILGLIFSQSFAGVLLFEIITAFGYAIKTLSETNLLYDSVSTRGGEGLYSKIDEKATSWYYFLDGILCLIAGYLFVINNYIPIYICAAFSLISTLVSFKFEDVHKKEKPDKSEIIKVIREYRINLITSVKFIVKSQRMKSFLIFGAVFYGLIRLTITYKSALLLDQGVSEEEFSTIFAVLTIITGAVISYSRKFHKKFRNKSLTVLSLTFVFTCLIASLAGLFLPSNFAIPIIIFACTIFKEGEAFWYVLEYKYLKNFTNNEIRNKIAFTYETIACLGASSISLLGSALLKVTDINHAFLLVSLVFIILLVLILDYMKPRMGLRPHEYRKEDINFDL